MTSLSPHGRALVEEVRRALQPTAADRARIANALAARLGTQILTPDLPASPSATQCGLQLTPAAGGLPGVVAS